MADTRLSDLASASALSASDLFYVVQSAGSGGEKATGTQLLTLVGTTYVAKSGGTMTGALTLPAGAVGTPSLMFTGSGATTGVYSTGATNVSIAVGGTQVAYWNGNSMWSAGAAGFGILAGGLMFGGTGDLNLYRDAAGILAQRNGTNAQTLRVYGTYTDSSNYERLSLSTTAGSGVTIAAETLGTGGDNLDIVLTPAGTGRVAVGNFLLYPTGVMAMFTNAAAVLWGASGDAGIHRGAAGQLDVTNGTAGTWRDLKLRNLIQTEYHELTEMTAPAAPATNSVRIYAEDNGSGKTRLMALFATGVAQQIAIEP